MVSNGSGTGLLSDGAKSFDLNQCWRVNSNLGTEVSEMEINNDNKLE